MLKYLSLCALTLLATTGCRSANKTSNAKSVEDIAAVTNSNGVMTIVCKNGSSEQYSSAEFRQRVAADSVCSTGGGSQSEYMCVAYSSESSKIAKISSGKTFGSNVKHQICQAAVKASRLGMVCIPYSSESSNIFFSSSESTEGSNVPHQQCNDLIKSASSEIVCVPYSSSSSNLYRLAAKSTLGTNVEHALCVKLAAASRNGLVCSPYSSSSSQLTRVSNGQTLGSNIPHQQCIDNLSSM